MGNLNGTFFNRASWRPARPPALEFISHVSNRKVDENLHPGRQKTFPGTDDVNRQIFRLPLRKRRTTCPESKSSWTIHQPGRRNVISSAAANDKGLEPSTDQEPQIKARQLARLEHGAHVTGSSQFVTDDIERDSEPARA